MAASSQSLFQSFTLQMEKIEDSPAATKSLPATIPDLQASYPCPDGESNQPPSQDLSFDNLTTFILHLPTLPPTPSTHHGDPGVKTATPGDDIPLTDHSTFSSPGEDDGSSTAPPEQELTFEYHGPGSFLSICSKSGIEWVNEKSGVATFGAIARSLISDVSRALKLSAPVPASREPEPPEEIAWQYCRTYFEMDPDTAFGIVHRPTFENALRTHFRKDDHNSDGEPDPGWYALRNAVYAAGCRIIETRTAINGSKTNAMSNQSWKYFSNALSVHSDLLYYRTSLMAVQALAMMSFFVEAVGYPSIDYMLCSSAMKLAQSKGLHRQPPAAWNLSKQVIQSRSLLWWSIYGFERVNANRAGRPLAIHDRDITCQMPQEGPEDCGVNLTLVASAISHAKLLSEINRRIAELKQGQTGLQELADTISDLTQQLDAWWDRLPDFMKLDLCDPSRVLPPYVHFQNVIYYHYAYYGSIVAIHSVLVHPWNSTALKVEPHEQQELAVMVANSMQVYVKATRKFVQYLPQLDVNALMPKWLVFVSPLTALINLFIYILQNPRSPSVDSDIGLMYLLAGHFSYLEYAVAERSFPFVGQMANLARLTANNARSRCLSIEQDLALDTSNRDGEGVQLGDDYFGDAPLDRMSLDNEEWATLIGWPEGDYLNDPCSTMR